MRLFAAVVPDAGVKEKLLGARQRLIETRADIRWVAAENLHVTVKFFGEVAEQQTGELLERMQKAAAQVPAFPLEIEGLDRLPEKGPARVIMSRVVSPDQRLVKLHRLIDSAAGGMGLPMDTRVLVPHLTLGRVSSNRGVNRLLRQLEKHDLDFFGSFAVQRVHLFQSLMGAGEDGAPKYAIVGTAACKTAAPA